MAKKITEKLGKTVETLTHDEASRKNIPTAEYQSVMRTDEQKPVRVEYARRNRDLDPQLVWRGKDEQDWSDLVVPAPPLYIQEKVHPKVLIPLQERIETVTDEADLEDVYNTERHLLYVACTRACDHLLVTSTDPASEFLDDIGG